MLLQGWSARFFGAVMAASLLLVAAVAQAVVLDDDKRISVKLEDGTDVVLYGEAGRARKTSYYYLPARLTVTTSDDDRPEFLFMKFVTNEDVDNGGAQGAILHFLVSWNLTKPQEEELREIVEQEHGGELKGAAPMFPQLGDEPSFSVVSATLGDSGMTQSLLTSGTAPLLPNATAAAAARMDSNAAQLLAKTFESDTTITDVTAVFNLAYETQLPAAKGRVVIDWSRIEQDKQTISAEYNRRMVGRESGKKSCFLSFCTSSKRNVYEYSYEEMRDEYSYLAEKRYITFEFEERVADERVGKIREAFINYFINSMSQPAQTVAGDRADDSGEEDENLSIRRGQKYSYDVNKISKRIQRGRQEFRMDYKLTLRWPLQVVGNLKSWYADAVADPQAVQTVVLDDPFFQRRDILFVMDAKDKDLYGSEINLTTITVRKNRGDGTTWESSVNLDGRHVDDHGPRAKITYARGEGPNSGTYEYKYQMSFRDGHKFPQEERWLTGDWEGVTLASPLKRRKIELEADLDQLAAADITRVTAQVRYPMLGKEEERNIQLSVAGREPLVDEQVFMNTSGEGYVYRLIFNHKQEGRLATEWSRRSSDNYIYAAVPEEFQLDVIEETAEKIIEAAKDAVVSEAGSQLARFDILLEEG